MKKIQYLIAVLFLLPLSIVSQVLPGNAGLIPDYFQEGSSLCFSTGLAGNPVLTGAFNSRLFLPQLASMPASGDFLSGLNGVSNSTGISLYNGIRFISKEGLFKDRENLRLLVGLENQYDQFLKAPAGFYELFFKGNARFAGETVDLSSLYFYSGFNQAFNLMAIYSQDRDDEVKRAAGAGLSFILSGYYNQTKITSGSLFTSETGDSLHLNADVSYLASASPYSGNPGLALSLMYEWHSEDIAYGISLKGPGFIVIKSYTQVKWDTQMSYTGVDILQNKTGVAGSLTDIIDTFNQLPEQPQSKIVFYYPELNLFVHKNEIYKNLDAWARLYWRTGYHFIPSFAFGLSGDFNSYFGFSAGVGNDYFGQVGLLTEIHFHSEHVTIGIGTRHLESPLLLQFNGADLSGILTWSF